MSTLPTSEATLEQLTIAFVAEYAGHYGFPQLLTAPIKHGGGKAVVHHPITPTGQFASLVRSAEMQIVVRPTEVRGVYIAEVGLYYSHHTGGQNGNTAAFYIATSGIGIDDDVRYEGYARVNVVDRLETCFYSHRKAKAAAEA